MGQPRIKYINSTPPRQWFLWGVLWRGGKWEQSWRM